MKLPVRASALGKKITLITTAFVLAVSSLTAAVPFVLAKDAAAADSVVISSVAELRSAIENQADGQVWSIQPGTYGLAPFSQTVEGQSGWYFPITADNLTINGVGNPTIYGTGYSPNGNWATQNLVSVFGDDVTINGLTLMPKVQPNKTIEVLGEDFTLKNSTITPNTISTADYAGVSADYQQWGGSLYFNHAGNHTIQNVTIKNAGISYRYSPSGTNINLSGVTLDYASSVDWINAYRYSSGFNNAGNTVTGAPSIVYRTSSVLNNLASVLANAKTGDTISLDSNLTLSAQLTLKAGVTLQGNGNTLTGAFVKTDNSNNAVVGVQSNGVKINNLTVDAVSGASNQLHGINVYESDGVELTGITAVNGRSGVVVGQGSTVVIDGISTSGNIWHGVNVDKPASHLTIKGANTHTEDAALFVDYRTVGTVVDADGRYDIVAVGLADKYILDIVAPSISWQVQPASLVRDTFQIRPITTEVGTTKSVYIDAVEPSKLCRTLTSDHKNFDVSQSACPALFAGLADGQHKFIAVFSDAAGNTTTSQSNTFVVDRTGPTVSLKSGSSLLPLPANGIFNTASFKLFDANKVDRAEINGHALELTNNNWSDLNNITVGSMFGTSGANTIKVWDVAGNVTEYSFTIDTVAPNATFTFSNNNGNAVTNQDVTVTMNTTEPIQTPADWTKVTDTQFTRVYSSNGKFSVAIADLAGNTATKNYEVKRIDKQGPAVTINGVGGPLTYRGTVGVGITDQNFSKVEVNGVQVSAPSAGGWNYALANALAGNGTYAIKAYDKGGNVTERTVTIDDSLISTLNVSALDTDEPTVSGRMSYVADNAPIANTNVVVTVDGETYYTQTDENGEWATPVLVDDGEHEVSIGIANGDTTSTTIATTSFTTTLPVVIPPAPPVDEGEEEEGAPAEGEGAPAPVATPFTAPAAINPSAFAGVLGTGTTDNTDANTEDTDGEAVEGASTEDILAQAVDADNTDGNALGLAWYWWLLIIAGGATGIWWLIAALRGRSAE